MSKKKSVTKRCLVVDASVARAAGPPESTHPTDTLCRDFLLALLDICHSIAWTEAIGVEWKKHECRFARDWRVSMVRKKKLKAIKAEWKVWDNVQEHCQDDHVRAIVSKDCHLLEAALASD